MAQDTDNRETTGKRTPERSASGRSTGASGRSASTSGRGTSTSGGSRSAGSRSTATRSATGTATKKRVSKKKKRQQRNRMILFALIFALAVTGVVFLVTKLTKNNTDTRTTPTATPGGSSKVTQPVNPTGEVTPDPNDPTGDPDIDWKTMPLTGLAFTEAMSSNSKYAALNNNYCDWIELTNVSTEPIRLSDYWISDSKTNPQKFQLPDVTLQAGERYIVYCNGVGEGNQALFKISSSGEKVYLSNAEGFCDRIKVPSDLIPDTSYGRKDGEWLYFDDPTPGTENGYGYAARTSVPEANYASGIYDKELQVTLFGEGDIYYTTDGSRPTTSSKKYGGAIIVSDVTTIRTFAVKDGRESEMTAYTYVINKTHDLPILVMSGPYDKTLGPNGVVHRYKKADSVEAEVMLTLIEGGEEKFSVPCGITLSGNNGGSRDIPKKNFNIKFRSAYGASKLNYKVFDDLDIESFDSLRLKGGAEDFYKSIIRDEFMTHMVIGNTALEAQASKPVVLYFDGEYWGIYFLRERFSDDYVASHYNVSEESVNLLQGVNASPEVGTAADFNELCTYVKNHDLNKQENYDYVASRIDLDSLMDFYICRSYMGDTDIGANVRYFRTTEGDNKWRWMYYDLDWGFLDQKQYPNRQLTNILKKDSNFKLQQLAWKIIHSKQGQDAYLKRCAQLMNTFLNEEYITKEIDFWKAAIESEVPADREYWSKAAKAYYQAHPEIEPHYSVSAAVSTWNAEIDRLYKFVKDGARDQKVLKDLKSYFGLSDAQMKEYFGDKYKP